MKIINKFLRKYFWLFIIGSLIGWVLEGIYSFLKYRKLINHSSVAIGPFNMIYGIGAIFFTMTLENFENSNIFLLFFISFIVGSLVEYITSFGMEKVLGFVAWDYSHKPFNLNGRICLGMSSLWGLLGIFWIKILYPLVKNFINSFDIFKNYNLMYAIIMFLIADAIFTYSAFKRAWKKEKGIKPCNGYERFLDKTFNKKYLTNMCNDSWGSK